MTDAGYIFAGYASTAAILGAYTAWVLRRKRTLGRLLGDGATSAGRGPAAPSAGRGPAAPLAGRGPAAPSAGRGRAGR